jgi:hypothetical protein
MLQRIIISAIFLLAVAPFGPNIWTGAKEAYLPTGYGLPLPWLIVSVPNRAVAMFHPETHYAFRVSALAADWFVFLVIVWSVSSIRNRRRARRRRTEGRCLACGYSLQGLDRPRCPECGTLFDR